MKGQITIFIMIGLVLLIAVGITLYVTSFIITKPKVVKKSVKEFVVDCLKLASENSFKEIGANGGYLEKDIRKIITHDNEKYSILINKPSHDVCFGETCMYYYKPWEYPWPLFPYMPGSQHQEIFTGYFGDSSLLPLPVIKTKLESDIKNKFKECANFQVLAKMGVDVQARAQPKVSVTFYNLTYLVEEQISQDRFTIIRLDWPLIESAGAVQTKEEVFSVKLPLRFATMYYSVEHIINNDISNISFVPEIQGMKIQVDHFEDFSLVNVTDHLSRIFGESYHFVFARENRNPALWYVQLPTNTFYVSEEGRPTRITINQNKKVLTFVDPCQGVIDVPLNASDADENDVFFTIDPKELKLGDTNLRINVSDNNLYDYQDIEVKVTTCT